MFVCKTQKSENTRQNKKEARQKLLKIHSKIRDIIFGAFSFPV